VLDRFVTARATLVERLPAQCDGRALPPGQWYVTSRKNRVRVARKTFCRKFEIDGPVTLATGRHKRRYRGRLTIESRQGRLVFHNLIEVEDYLLGVVGVEARAGFHEALKAQAVVSRTYALASRGRHQKAGHDLCDLTHCQLYRGMAAERPDVEKAILETQGEVLRTRLGKLGSAYFHASCGGATSAPEDVFGGSSESVGVKDTLDGAPLCATVTKDTWIYRLKRTHLSDALGVAYSKQPLRVLKRDAGGRALKLSAFGSTYRADTFLSNVGKAFGFMHLKSAFFEVRNERDFFVFLGRGRGHGVGLCQNGAWARARRGEDYRRILKHYFPRESVERL
jgi:stage II sporulation protein D